jgi:ATP-binding cassette subfamily F protein 3
MSLIRLENISKSFAGEPVLENVDFRVEVGEKVGLIGRNGSGKSTLFRIILGEEEPNTGTIERMRRSRVGCLAQLPELDDHETIYDVAMRSFDHLTTMERELGELEERLGEADAATLERYGHVQEEFVRQGGYEYRTKLKRVLHGLGFFPEDYGLRVTALSGGQRTRLMLALVLLLDADLLLLDEPENHLDLEAREWLEGFLKDWPAAFVIISHDRQMLNAVAGRIVEVERRTVSGFTGNYEAFTKHKALLREQQQEAFVRQQAHIEKEEKWIDRFRYKNTKAAAVQSRIKRLEKLERVEAPPPEAPLASIGFGEVVRSGQAVVTAKNLSMAYGDLTLYDGISMQVERGERLGIIGANGTGKTTLLRQLAGRLPEGTGTVELGNKVSLGFYEQHHEGTRASHDIFTEILEARPEMLPEQVRSFMGRFLFRGDAIFKSLTSLSGGELCRVAIAKLILGGANVLLLDEPTNHLDIASREALENALSQYPGTIIMVSHDRALIDRLVERLIIVGNGKATVHLGNYSHYRWKLADEGREEDRRDASETMRIRKQEPAKPRIRGKEADKERRKLQRKLQAVERDITAMEELIDGYEAKFAAVDPSDFTRSQELTQEYEGLKGDLEHLYMDWEEISERIG